MKRILWTTVALAAAIPGLAAQVPAHATLLNPTTLQYRPTLLQDGDRAHAFAYGYPGGLLHARSLDGGRTWPLREQLLGVFAIAGTLPEPTLPIPVATRLGELLVLVDDLTLGPRLVRSFDQGTTWSTPVAVTTTATLPAARRHPSMHVDGATIVAAWFDERTTGRVWANRSVDGGATWPPADTRLDVGITVLATAAVRRPQVLGSGPNVHVVWGQGWTRYQRSTDGGATWLPQAVTLPGPGGVPLFPPVDTAIDGPLLFVVSDNGQLARSGDGGASWNLVTNHGVPHVREVAVHGTHVVATGTNNQFAAVYFVATSTDGGVTWLPPVTLPSATLAVQPHALATAGALFVNFEVPGFPGNAIRSTDGGASWLVVEGPVGGGFAPGERRTIHVAQVGASVGSILFHAYAGVGSTPLGDATTGSGGIAPRLATIGLPVRGDATTLQVDATVGSTPGALGLSFSPPTTIPFGSATVHLAALDVLVSFAASGTSGQPGAGSFGLQVGIPPTQSLVGRSIVAQALVLDAGVADGFTVTNALEIWLR